MTQPLVSVITPVLNRVETIDLCLRSVANQRYPNIEHIVVDGGSTDGTLEAIQRCAEQTSIRWVSGRDGGMYEAINKGLELARGSVLAYLNSDDLYLPWSVEVAVGALVRENADLVFGDLAVLVKGRGRDALYVQFYPEFDLRHYTFHGTMAQPTVFWTSKLGERLGGFDASYKLLGDCDHWLRAAEAEATLLHIPEVLAVQVEHANTLRELNREALRSEFERLRAEHRELAGAPRSAFVAGARRRLEWRVKQAQLLFASKRDHPLRWSEFIGLMREADLSVDPRYLFWHLIPRPARPEVSLFPMPAAEQAILGTAT
jgi:glycosyltransferase involved in cell wall biosynthesis